MQKKKKITTGSPESPVNKKIDESLCKNTFGSKKKKRKKIDQLLANVI